MQYDKLTFHARFLGLWYICPSTIRPTATQVAAFLLSLRRDYGLAPQEVKASVSAEPHLSSNAYFS